MKSATIPIRRAKLKVIPILFLHAAPRDRSTRRRYASAIRHRPTSPTARLMDVTAPQTVAERMMPVDLMMPVAQPMVVAPPMAVGCFARGQAAMADSQARDNPAAPGSSQARDTRHQAPIVAQRAIPDRQSLPTGCDRRGQVCFRPPMAARTCSPDEAARCAELRGRPRAWCSCRASTSQRDSCAALTTWMDRPWPMAPHSAGPPVGRWRCHQAKMSRPDPMPTYPLHSNVSARVVNLPIAVYAKTRDTRFR